MPAKILIVFGTRPEIIKLASLIRLIKESKARKDYSIVCTSQQEELLEEQISFWNIEVDYFLPSLPPNTNLTRLLAHTLSGLQDILDKVKTIEYVLVQGDTNTALACSQVAFLNQLKLLHVEAGLRSFDLTSPFPEEFNRIVASKVAYFHFAPTELSEQNLIKEGISSSKILITGNTVVDAIRSVQNEVPPDTKKDLVLITLHRRENIENNYLLLIDIVKDLMQKYPLLKFLWVSHPNCSQKVKAAIKTNSKFEAVQHLSYRDFIALYNSAKMVITDSGGVCEESVQMGIPLVVFRKVTERNEPLLKGYPLVVTLKKEEVVKFFEKNIEKNNSNSYSYGDGNASQLIFDWLKKEIESVCFDTVIIGGGLAGTGILLKLMKDGNDEEFLKNKFALVEKSSELVKGSITDYLVNSDTFSDVFLECLEGSTCQSINIHTLKDEIEFIKTFKGKTIPLNTLSNYLRKLGDLIIKKISGHSACKLFLNTSSHKIVKNDDGQFTLFLNGGIGKIHAKKIIIASGAVQNLPEELQFAKTISLNNYFDKIIHSDDLLKGSQRNIANYKTLKKIVILGGSHSAFSSAWYLLNSVKDLGENSIRMWCKTQPLIYFLTKEEALAAGYHDFTEEDICPVTKRVYRLAGLRMDGRDLLMRMKGLQGYVKEKRVALNTFNDLTSELNTDLSEADLIILAYGYRFNMIPLYNENKERIAFIGEKTGHWVNQSCELLDNKNEIISNLYATGLATGFIPSGDLGGEPSFGGQTNGIWYYQNALAEVIIKKLRHENLAIVS